MHELGYAEGVLEAIERRAQGRTVARFGVHIGCLHRVVAEAFAQSFQLVAAGGPAAHAVAEVTVIPAQAVCWDCRHLFETDNVASACPVCGSLDTVVTGGDEVMLTWLEYVDVREAAKERVPAHTHEGGDAHVPGHPG